MRSTLQLFTLLANREYGPVCPTITSACVDVRDVARAHVLATRSKLPGGHRYRRYICSLRPVISVSDIARSINKQYAHLNAPTYAITRCGLTCFSCCDARITEVVIEEWAAEGKPGFDNSRIVAELDGFGAFEFADLDVMTRDTVDSMIKFGLVPAPKK